MRLSHFFVTRFNVKMGFSSGDERLSEEWLLDRLALFREFCYPSMRAQTEKNFRWLVLLDPQSPNSIKQSMEALADWPCFMPVYLADYSRESMSLEVSKHLPKGSSHLITTRLDSDDAVAVDLAARIQRHSGRGNAILNFPLGFIWEGGKTYKVRDYSNPFASFSETVHDKPLTICGTPHTELHNLGTVHQIRDDPAWLQVIHGGNVTNCRRGRRCRSHHALRNFAVEPPVSRSESFIEIYGDALSTHLRETVKTLAGLARKMREPFSRP